MVLRKEENGARGAHIGEFVHSAAAAAPPPVHFKVEQTALHL